MSNHQSLQPTKYAQQKYGITQPVDFDVAVKYGVALMAIAGAEGNFHIPEIKAWCHTFSQ